MTRIPAWMGLSLLMLASTGCSGPLDAETLGSLSEALNACNETVPADRFVDGLPAYAQCSDVSSGNVWSNNGIDTATVSGGDGWIQTQRGGGYQCTEWAYRYMRFRWNVHYRNGNAKEWCNGNLPNNLVKSTTPVHGDLIVFDGGVCGSDSVTGHVAVVDVVNSEAGTVTIVEQNRAGRRNTKQSCALCFLHAVANDGSGAAAGGASGGGAQDAGRGGAPTSSGTGGRSGGEGARTGNGGAQSGASAAGGAPERGGAPSGGAPQYGGAPSGGAPQYGAAGANVHPAAGAQSGGAHSGALPSGGTSSQGGSLTSPGSAAAMGRPPAGIGGSVNPAEMPNSAGTHNAIAGSAAAATTPGEGDTGCTVSMPGAPGRPTHSASLLGLAFGLLLWAKRRERPRLRRGPRVEAARLS